MRYRARIRVTFRKTHLYTIHREAIVLTGINRFGSADAMRRDAIGCDAFLKRHDLHGLSTSNGSTSRSSPRQCNGNRVMDGTRWKISTMPGARESVIVFPLRGCGGGLGVCLIRGNILMSRSIIYVYMSASTCHVSGFRAR